MSCVARVWLCVAARFQCKTCVDGRWFPSVPSFMLSSIVYADYPAAYARWLERRTGKRFVQGHGGITLELLKFIHLRVDLKPDDRMFFFTTTGWIVWNLLLTALMTGAAVILYDGNPARQLQKKN